MTRISRIAPVLALGVLIFAACPKKQKPVTPATPAGPTQAQLDSMARERQRQDSIARIEQARRDSIARIEAARADSLARIQAAATRVETVRTAVTAVVYFDYNSAELSQDARATLETKIPLLSGNPELKIRVAGHSDERGSDEYNLALGQRRAAAAKRYLTQRGIAAGRIETVSYGEERPSVDGHDEAAWAQNRRDEFEITGGGESIRPTSP